MLVNLTNRTPVLYLGRHEYAEDFCDWRWHDQVRQARDQGGRLPRLGQGGGGEGTRRCGHPLRGRRTGLRRLLLRRLDLRSARPLPVGPHWNSRRQREQQLLDGKLCALPRAPGRARWDRRLRDGDRLREDGAGLAGRQVHRPHQRPRQARHGDVRPTRARGVTGGSADVRQRRRDHMDKYGSEPDHYAWIGWKNHKHSVNNPYAQFQTEYSLDEIKEARMIHSPLTKLQCSPTSDGSACAIVASEGYVDSHDLWGQAVEIAGQSMVTDLSSTFADDTDCIRIVGYDMSKQAAERAYDEAGVGPDEVDVCELHDCFSANELITYEALGFAAEGEGHKLVEAEATTYGGDGPVVNPSGGLISKGHPLGATGLAQCSELTWQLRGDADKRQVDGAKVALQHNIGLGGAAVVSVYKPAAA